MKKSLAVTIISLLVLVAAAPQAAWALDLSPTQEQALQNAGIPVYPGAKFSTADEETGTLWFDTKDPVNEVMDWYEEELSDWAAANVHDRRILYNGPKGLDVKEMSTKSYIFAVKSNNYPGDPWISITVRIQ